MLYKLNVLDWIKRTCLTVNLSLHGGSYPEYRMTHMLPPPKEFSIHDSNAAEMWKSWRDRFRHYLVATKLDKESEAIKISTLLTIIGSDAHKVYSTFDFGDEGESLQRVLNKFEEYCQPLKNVPFERFRFNSRAQMAGEPFEQYVTALRQLQSRCEFEMATPDELLRDRIVFGISDCKVRERLLRESNLTLGRTLEVCYASEVSLA